MIFNSTRLIAETFEENDLDFFIEEVTVEHKPLSVLHTTILVKSGPTLTCRFLSHDNNSDVSVMVQGLFNEVPLAKRTRVIEACNKINRTSRFAKFFLSKNGSLNVGYDLPPWLDDSAVGDACFHLSFIIEQVISANYGSLAKIIFDDTDDKPTDSKALSQLLENLATLHEKPIVIDERDHLVGENILPTKDVLDYWEDLIYQEDQYIHSELDAFDDEEELPF